MAQGSIAVPGAIIMVNNDLSVNIQNRLITQLHINEVITGQEFDIRFAADNNYPRNVRVLRTRIMVIRDHRDQTNRTEMDIVIFVKNGMASISRNCFAPPGQTYLVKDLYWGALCIYNTIPERTCQVCNTCTPPTTCIDGYGRSPYYPALYDPAYPAENHDYYNQLPNTGIFGSQCSATPEFTLCRVYYCNSDTCIPQVDCRLVKASG